MAPYALQPQLTYQGIPCLEGDYENTQGTASGHGYVVMTQKNFRELVIRGDPWAPLPAGAVGTTVRGDQDGKSPIPPLGAGLQIRGELVFNRPGVTSVVLPAIYVSEHGVEDLARSVERDVDRGKVRIPLVDVRAMWTRGDVHGEYNITREGVPIGGLLKTVDRASPSGIGFLEETLKPSPAVPGGVGPAQQGDPFTLADLIRICLARLPGKLTLRPSPEVASAEAIVPINIRWRGESALNALNALLGAWNFRFVYDCFGNEAQIWRMNEGRPEANDTGGILLSLKFPGKTPVEIAPASVLERRRTRQFFYRPRSVRVVGRPMIREVRIDGLEAVGELEDGTIVPLDQALARIQVPNAASASAGTPNATTTAQGIGGLTAERADPLASANVGNHGLREMTRDELAKWVLLNPDEQVAWRGGALSKLQVEGLRRWGFKWFRLPEAALAFTPILPYRARAMVVGSRVKPAIFADIFDEIPFDAWGKKYQEELARITARVNAAGPVGDAGAAIEEALDVGKWSLRFGGGTDQATKDRVAQEIAASLSRDLDQVVARAAIERREVAQNEGNEIRFFNRYRVKINPALYDVDQNGVVRFQRVIGAVQIAPGRAAGLPNFEASGGGTRFQGVPVYVSEGAVLDPNPRVAIVFAYESNPRARKLLASIPAFGFGYKPTLDKGADYVDHYSYLGTIDGASGKVVQLNPGGVEPENAADYFPRVVRQELKCFEDENAKTNRADLDAAATAIVQRELEGDDQVKGERGESASYWPIQPTGAVISTSWQFTPTKDGPVARTRWVVGVESQLSQNRAVPTQVRLAGTGGVGTHTGPTTSDEGPRR